MAKENITPEMIDLKDWNQSGEGWNAITYNHRTDDSLLLKLNSEPSTYEDALAEFRLTNAVHDFGVKCPEALKLVTDGRRFGYITTRFNHKKSFARMLSEHPEMLDTLAGELADATRSLHSIQCDTEEFESIPERMRRAINSCSWIDDKQKAILNSYADGMRPVTTCLHGDMHPGNYLRTDKGDFWIDMGRFGYGDPDMDYANQYFLANLAPGSMVRWLLHIDRNTYSRFVERYGQYYYGDEFHSAETQERLRRAVFLMAGNAMTKSRAAGFIYGSFIRGHEKRTSVLLKMISPLIRKK